VALVARRAVIVKRFLVFVVLVGSLGALGWFGVSLVRDHRAEETRATTPTAAPLQVLRIVFPEGYTREQMAEQVTAVNAIARKKRHVTPRLSAEQYLALTRSSKFAGGFAGGHKRSLEGFLFPATYEFTKRTTTKQLIKDQLDAFRENWSQVDLAYAKSKNLTPYDVLIIASLIEKEVAAPEERGKVASVIYNRLKARMPLGIDASIRYGLDVPPTESLHESQLHDPNPYNTRVHAGLPPGPIANPGLASMQAAAHPKKTDFLYFVRKPDKRHHAFFDNQTDFDAYQAAHGY
jgi:uncharacterized YceG family protein